MIEKVAKAIFENDWEREWSTAENYEREHFIKTAKAAIEAMLEPTDKMCSHSGIPIANAKLIWQDMAGSALNGE